VPELPLTSRPLKAIVFDLDGTLYYQDALRRAMLVRLVRAHALRPWLGVRTARALSAYRAAQESLRVCAPAPVVGDLAEEQLRRASERAYVTPEFVATCVERWMEREPLDLVARHMYQGARDFLLGCRARGLRLGLLSDYPAHAKLAALQLEEIFDVVLTAQSPDVGVFKPDPRGLRLVLQRLDALPAESLYVGDRVDVDAQVAAALGMGCCILGDRNLAATTKACQMVGSYAELRSLVLDDAGDSTEPRPAMNLA